MPRFRDQGRVWVSIVFVVALSSMADSTASGASGAEAQARIAADIAAGRPVVVHLVVALCDNQNQGIVPVPRSLGNGQDPRSNLYWGARFGVRGYFGRERGWKNVDVDKPIDKRIRERLVYSTEIQRGNRAAAVYVVADAWDGAEMRSAIQSFFAIASGRAPEDVSIRRGSQPLTIQAGGVAHLAAFVGHNGLMDFSLPPPDRSMRRQTPGSSIVLACASKPYFLDRLHGIGSHPLLLTTGLMAPEAYTLDAVIRSWIGDGSVTAAREAAATAYDRYQKCGLRAARNLFWSESP